MAVTQLYTARLRYLIQAEGSIDGNGDFVNGEDTWSDDIECEAVPSGTPDEKVFEDGKVRRYDFTVYTHPSERDFTIGERVLLTRYGQEYSERVCGFMRYQHQCIIWIGRWG